MLLAGLLVLSAVLYWPMIQEHFRALGRLGSSQVSSAAGLNAAASSLTLPTASPTPTDKAGSIPTAETPSPPPYEPPTHPPTPASGSSWEQGLIVVSAIEAGYSHLFAYHPFSQPFTRLTNGAWDDITPAISPDGTHLAFASNRGGYWDLYLMHLATGQITQLTDTPEYEASPSFSPDGLWLVYESYQATDTGGNTGDTTGGITEGNLDLFIRPLDGSQEPIRLTDDPAADFSPAWSPHGRLIAFISNRTGENELWLADLDQVDDRFRNLSQNSSSVERHPAWSADGGYLAWSSETGEGVQSVVVWPFNPSAESRVRPYSLGGGGWPVWSPDGKALLTNLVTPNRTYLTGFELETQGIFLPPLPLSGSLRGITWGAHALPASILDAYSQAAGGDPPALWAPALTPMPDVPNGRQRVVPLEDVEAPNAYLNDLVDEAFVALRQAISQRAGWDFLASLENAFVPVTSSLLPGMKEDWLYTGRAIAFNSLPMNAGWLVVVRQDFGAETYWRVYLRTRFQDGTQGEPLHDLPWDFSARASGNPRYYEQGGALQPSIPAGYWLDLTELAAAYNWERVPALNTWRSAYLTTRFNEFVLSDGLDWKEAMLQLYPPEALVTPTVATPTQIPSATPRPSRTPTPTRTPRPSPTSSPTPTPSLTATP